MLLGCRTTVGRGRVSIVLDGELDLSTVPQLNDHLSRSIQRHPGVTITLQLDGLHAADDIGLSSLLASAALTRRLGGTLVLSCSPGALADRLTELGLDRVIDTVS